MRLVTWNCKGAFAKKHSAVAALEPDILVVPESEKPAGVCNVLGCAAVRSVEWAGDNPKKKGLAVLSYGDYHLELHEAFDPRLRWVLPLKVAGPVPFTLFAVWTVPHEETRYYVQCLFEALEAYQDLLASPPVVWAGDFNNTFRLDRPAIPLKFADFVHQMSARGLLSLYHLQTDARMEKKHSRPSFFTTTPRRATTSISSSPPRISSLADSRSRSASTPSGPRPAITCPWPAPFTRRGGWRAHVGRTTATRR